MNHDHWIRHFEENTKNRPEPDWQAPLGIQGRALSRLRRSIQQFQLGDGGGPAQLIAWNRDRYLSDEATRRLVDLWFKEEKEHSRLLGDLLRRLGGEPIATHWSFELFCGVRKWFGVNFELQALLSTELVSNVYYQLLRKHGDDPVLRGVCHLIIRDETGHIAFHRARLAAGYSRCGPLRVTLFRLRTLAAGTVLWINHRGAVRSLGGSDAEFYRGIWRDVNTFLRALRREKPHPLHSAQPWNGSQAKRHRSPVTRDP